MLAARKRLARADAARFWGPMTRGHALASTAKQTVAGGDTTAGRLLDAVLDAQLKRSFSPPPPNMIHTATDNIALVAPRPVRITSFSHFHSSPHRPHSLRLPSAPVDLPDRAKLADDDADDTLRIAVDIESLSPRLSPRYVLALLIAYRARLVAAVRSSPTPSIPSSPLSDRPL